MPKKTRRRWTDPQKAEIVREFQESGLALEAFARTKGIYSSTIGSWIRRHGRLQKKTPEVVPVGLKSTRADSDSRLEVVLRSGRRIVVTSGYDEKLLLDLIATLERC